MQMLRNIWQSTLVCHGNVIVDVYVHDMTALKCKKGR